MAILRNLPFLLVLSSLFAALCNPCLAFQEDRKAYIVYMGALPSYQVDQFSIQNRQLSLLRNVLQGSSAEDRLLESYKRSFNGFAAFLTEEERQKIARMKGVVSVFPSKTYHLRTTRSWGYVGFSEPMRRMLEKESDIIIGVLDSGIWPKSESFSDEGFGPPPKKWKGICQTEGNFTCNNKVIGARYYKSSEGEDLKSARDTIGHGTHTASTAAGRRVRGASFFGLAQGNARGAVPSARIAVYKVCGDDSCSDASILAGFDDAIADGVDILSVSLGSDSVSNYSSDSVAIGSFQAMLRGILTSQSASNSGPGPGIITSVAPWLFSVAASSTDRQFITEAIIGDKVFRLSSGEGPLSAGAQEQIMQSDVDNDYSSNFPLPSTVVNMAEGDMIKSYIRSTEKPHAKILRSVAIRDSNAPAVVSFSSRGPNLISSYILKPDITAPGVDIIAAYSPVSSLTGLEQDKRSANYAILSGTSMSCPHVAGAAAYVKSFHPEWSPAAIKSALITTAFSMNGSKNIDLEFAYGAGQINPVKALSPGLVYDTNKDDYLQFLCNEGYTAGEIKLISGENIRCSRKTTKTAADLNYPSIQLLVDKNRAFSGKFSRSVTNVGSPASTYKATVKQLPGLQIAVTPSVISFKSVNEKRSFVVTITGKGLPAATVISTSLVWSDGVHSVRSPIVVYTSVS